eukprot:scaffold1555_cov173-Amphora_coffeaeformis.AAC.14
MREDEIDRRLGFLKREYNRALPRVPLPKERHHPPTAENNSSPMAGRPYLKRNVIATSMSNHRLMRQMSALGMEDPVFGTTEDGPKHPSNIFDDMSMNDVPEDMRDMVSVASDPTADEGRGGLDVTAFRTCLGHVRSSSSPSIDFSMMELAIPAQSTQRSSFSQKGPSCLVEGDVESLSEKSLGFDKFQSEARFAEGPTALEQRVLPAAAKAMKPRQPLKQPMRQETEHVRTTDVSLRKANSKFTQESVSSFASHSRFPHQNNGGGSVASKTSKTTLSGLTEETPALSIAEKADRLVSPRNKKDRIRYNSSRKSPTKNAVAKITADARKHDAPRVPQRRDSTNPGGTMLDAYTQSLQEQYATAIPHHAGGTTDSEAPSIFHRGDSLYQPEEKGSSPQQDEEDEKEISLDQMVSAPSTGPSIFHRGDSLYQPEAKGTTPQQMLSTSETEDNEFSLNTKAIPMAVPTVGAPSIFHRGDSIYQPVKRAETSLDNNMIKKEKANLPNASTTLTEVQPSGAPAAPSASSGKTDEIPAKSRAMPSIANLFPGAGAAKRTRRRTPKAAVVDSTSAPEEVVSPLDCKTVIPTSQPPPRTFRTRTTTTACYSIAPATP